MRIARFGLLIVVAGLGLAPAACQTTEPGVRSTMFNQYTTIEASTVDATKASAEVLKDLGLQNIESSATNVDGWAKGMKADKTPVKVTLTRVGDKVSDISVKIGSFGDAALGKDIIARVRKELGLKPPATAVATESTTK